MNAKQIGLSVVLADFVGLSAYAVYQHGYFGMWALAASNVGTLQVFADVIIALSLIMAWMVRDARERGISPLPYVLLTLALGSIGPLVYLIRRFGNEPARAAHPVVASAARS